MVGRGKKHRFLRIPEAMDEKVKGILHEANSEQLLTEPDYRATQAYGCALSTLL